MKKTTLEMPDTVFRLAKSRAAERGIPLRQFVTEAVEEKLKRSSNTAEAKPWMKHMGKLRGLRAETRRIQKAIDEAFEKIDPEAWDSDIRG
ncbi:MAG TPA: hypothetical protein VIY69_09245 [Candidatus Acidoferrales bacterium]